MAQFIKRISILICFTGLLFNQLASANNIKYGNPLPLETPVSIPFFDIRHAQVGEDTTSKKSLDIDQIADSLTQKVIGENKIVDLLDPGKVYTLPIGIGKMIGGLYYIVVLDDLRFTPSGLTAKAYMSLSFPGSTKKFGLMADNVKIGVGGIQAAQLKMLKDVPVDLPGGNSLLIKADSTFVEWDCNGYKGAQLAASISLDEKVFYKENPTTRSIIAGAKVKGKVLCSVVDFNDILLNISLDPFQVKGLKDFSFYTNEIVLDLSDTRNPGSMQFPSGFESALCDSSNTNLWRGLYINTFKLKFPKKFAKNGSPPEVTASEFLIDFEGISGYLNLRYPLVSLEEGSLGGWKFSIESLTLRLDKNNITGFGMGGGVVLPITEQNRPLNYMASLGEDGNFLFQVTLPGNLKVPLFGSESSLIINSNSTISVESRGGEFNPRAVLNGKMKIGTGGSSGASLADIAFEGLTIQRDDPQLDIKSLSMQSGMMAGFPVQISKIGIERKSNDLGLLFEASANLMDGKIQGATSFVVWATRNGGNWAYKDIELRKISVDANTGSISLKGQLINYKNHQIFGNGFYGSVDMSITPGIAVSATAQFGSVSDYRYWYADASVSLSAGITVFPGFAIYGFGGGAYYHMQRNLPASILMSTEIASTPAIPTPGKTTSGVTYTPNNNISLGLNAKVIIGTQPSPNAFNGSVTFGMEFTPSFGIGKLYFNGDGRFMTEVNKDGSDSKVKAKVDIQYLFANNELTGSADAYINVADAIKGNGPDNHAGRVEFYFAKSKWFIYVGTPTSPINVKLMNTLTATSYFMVGTILPDFPALPSNISSLSSKVNFTNMRSDDLTRTGGGFAFGASIKASTGEQNFAIFYGKFDLGAGFDLMLKNFGNNARCEGFSGPLGINGWYAQGQAWAYVDAKIGVKVKVFRRTKKFTIMDAGFAAVLGAQLPNPTYLAGAAEARFSVLGGLVKGKCHFEFDYGTQCKLANASAVEGINVIGEVTPSEGAKNVDVFLTPQAAFNMPINEPFKILDTDGKEKSFRAVLDYFKILDGNQVISSIPEWNSTNDVLALRPLDVLAGQKQLKVSVKIHFQIKEGEGVWTDYKVDGNVEGEERTVAFITGDAPDYITDNNVNYTYPVKNMVNFYKNEYGKSYIQLYQGVNYLFTKPGSWRYEANFKSGSNTSKVAVTYNNTTKRVEFNVPDNLVNSSIYSLKIVRVPDSNSAFKSDKNVVKVENSISSEQSVTTKDIEGVLAEEGVTELYSLHFRTSKFNSFVEKMNSFQTTDKHNIIGQGVVMLLHSLKNSELFGKWEMENIRIEALLDNKWYNTNYKDLIYSNYPVKNDVTIKWRDPILVGIPPVKSCQLIQSTPLIELTQNNISSGSFTFDPSVIPRIEHFLSHYVIYDWIRLRELSFNYPTIPALKRIIDFSLVGLKYDEIYNVRVKYYIPGLAEPTSLYTTSIYF